MERGETFHESTVIRVVGFRISRLGTSVGKTLKDRKKKKTSGKRASVGVGLLSHCGESKRNRRKVRNEGK